MWCKSLTLEKYISYRMKWFFRPLFCLFVKFCAHAQCVLPRCWRRYSSRGNLDPELFCACRGESSFLNPVSSRVENARVVVFANGRRSSERRIDVAVFFLVLWSYSRKICLNMCHGNSENSDGCSYVLRICFIEFRRRNNCKLGECVRWGGGWGGE